MFGMLTCLLHFYYCSLVLEREVERLERVPELFGHLDLFVLAHLAVPPVYPVLHVQQRFAGERLPAELVCVDL